MLLHASLGDARMWDDQVDVFAGELTVVRYDVRGFGRSPVGPGEISLRRDLLAVLDAHQVERAALVGTSLGANTALEVAVTAPERVWALVLVGASLPGHEWSEEVRAYRAARDDAVRAGNVEAAVAADLETWLADGTSVSVRERVAGMLRHAYEVQRHVWDAVSAERLDPPVTDRLGSIRVPTLVVVGSEDVADLEQVAGELVHGIRGARQAVIEGAAHAPSMEQPAAFNRLVLDFLREAAPPPLRSDV